jgi:hypothetical protein
MFFLSERMEFVHQSVNHLAQISNFNPVSKDCYVIFFDEKCYVNCIRAQAIWIFYICQIHSME